MMSVIPNKGKRISFLKIFTHEDRTSAMQRKNSSERNVTHASEVIGGRPLKERIVSIGKRDHRTADENMVTSPILS